jgi:hypothetical protein
VGVLITRKKYEEARTTLLQFYNRFPNSVLKSRADQLKEQIDKEGEGGNKVTGTSGNVIGLPNTGSLIQQQRISR